MKNKNKANVSSFNPEKAFLLSYPISTIWLITLGCASLSYYIIVRYSKKGTSSSISNWISLIIYRKNVRALAGKATGKIGKCMTIWRDLNIKSIYSTQPWPIKFKIILDIKTESKSLFAYLPAVFNDYIYKLLINYFFRLEVRFQKA